MIVDVRKRPPVSTPSASAPASLSGRCWPACYELIVRKLLYLDLCLLADERLRRSLEEGFFREATADLQAAATALVRSASRIVKSRVSMLAPVDR
jgi:hypothetical protein